MRDSFLLFTEQRELIECLTDEQAGRLFKLLYNYAADVNIEIDNDIKLAFIAIRQQIDRNNIKYDEVVEKRRANGQKGGAPLGNSNAKKNNQNNQNNLMVDLVDLKTTKNNQNNQNKHNDNVNDNVNDNDNENDYSFKKEKKEKSFQNFQNSDFKETETNAINAINEINEINETSLRAIAKQSNDGNNTPLEAKKEESGGVFKPPKAKATDPYISPELDRYFRVYEELCPNLARLRFERRNAQIRELLARFIAEIDDDVGYFKSLCQKANELKRICERQIDLKMLINNHIGIFNGKYENDSFDVMDLFKNKNKTGETTENGT